MQRNMTEAKTEWVKSTIRQMQLAGFEPTGILTKGFEEYIKGRVTFYQLCAIMRDEGE
jgi:hypothetical protein